MAGKISKNCVICENEFFVYPSTQSTKTCSRKCSAKLSNQTRTTRVSKHCVICGKPFEVTKGRAKATRACSKKCASILGGRTQNKQATLICEVCGKPFKVPPCREKTAKTCSDKCAVLVRAKSRERKVTCICKNCGKSFESPQSQAEQRVYCSMICKFSDEDARQKRSEQFSGANNPQWKGGISCEPYCVTWNDKEFVEYILERDGYSCQNPECWGTSNKLVRHHIDYDKKNCSPSNVITVCNSCNGRANKEREWHTGYYNAILEKRLGQQWAGKQKN